MILPLLSTISLFIGFSTAQTSSVSCVYADWATNKNNESPCQVWATLGSKCGSFNVDPITPASAPYPAPQSSDDCQCNIVAYSLMTACSWCQADIYSGNWLSLQEWSANCPNFDSSGISSSLNVTGINIPPFASQAVLTPKWDPGDAQAHAATLGNGGNGHHNSGTTVRGNTLVVAVVVAIFGGPWAILLIIVGCIYWRRQKTRKQMYGAMAQHYQNGGAPPWVQ